MLLLVSPEEVAEILSSGVSHAYSGMSASSLHNDECLRVKACREQLQPQRVWSNWVPSLHQPLELYKAGASACFSGWIQSQGITFLHKDQHKVQGQ